MTGFRLKTAAQGTRAYQNYCLQALLKAFLSFPIVVARLLDQHSLLGLIFRQARILAGVYDVGLAKGQLKKIAKDDRTWVQSVALCDSVSDGCWVGVNRS